IRKGGVTPLVLPNLRRFLAVIVRLRTFERRVLTTASKLAEPSGRGYPVGHLFYNLLLAEEALWKQSWRRCWQPKRFQFHLTLSRPLLSSVWARESCCSRPSCN